MRLAVGLGFSNFLARRSTRIAAMASQPTQPRPVLRARIPLNIRPTQPSSSTISHSVPAPASSSVPFSSFDPPRLAASVVTWYHDYLGLSPSGPYSSHAFPSVAHLSATIKTAESAAFWSSLVRRVRVADEADFIKKNLAIIKANTENNDTQNTTYTDASSSSHSSSPSSSSLSRLSSLELARSRAVARLHSSQRKLALAKANRAKQWQTQEIIEFNGQQLQKLARESELYKESEAKELADSRDLRLHSYIQLQAEQDEEYKQAIARHALASSSPPPPITPSPPAPGLLDSLHSELVDWPLPALLQALTRRANEQAVEIKNAMDNINASQSDASLANSSYLASLHSLLSALRARHMEYYEESEAALARVEKLKAAIEAAKANIPARITQLSGLSPATAAHAGLEELVSVEIELHRTRAHLNALLDIKRSLQAQYAGPSALTPSANPDNPHPIPLLLQRRTAAALTAASRANRDAAGRLLYAHKALAREATESAEQAKQIIYERIIGTLSRIDNALSEVDGGNARAKELEYFHRLSGLPLPLMEYNTEDKGKKDEQNNTNMSVVKAPSISHDYTSVYDYSIYYSLTLHPSSHSLSAHSHAFRSFYQSFTAALHIAPGHHGALAATVTRLYAASAALAGRRSASAAARAALRHAAARFVDGSGEYFQLPALPQEADTTKGNGLQTSGEEKSLIEPPCRELPEFILLAALLAEIDPTHNSALLSSYFSLLHRHYTATASSLVRDYSTIPPLFSSLSSLCSHLTTRVHSLSTHRVHSCAPWIAQCGRRLDEWRLYIGNAKIALKEIEQNQRQRQMKEQRY